MGQVNQPEDMAMAFMKRLADLIRESGVTEEEARAGLGMAHAALPLMGLRSEKHTVISGRLEAHREGKVREDLRGI